MRRMYCGSRKMPWTVGALQVGLDHQLRDACGIRVGNAHALEALAVNVLRRSAGRRSIGESYLVKSPLSHAVIRFSNVSCGAARSSCSKARTPPSTRERIGLIGANGSASRACSRCCAASCTPTRARWISRPLAPRARGAGDAGARAPGGGIRDRRRQRAARPGGAARGGPGRRADRRAARGARRCRRLHRALARNACSSAWASGTTSPAPGLELSGLAHAPEPRAGADVPVGAAAARRADQPPRPRRHHLARGVAQALSRDAARRLARPRSTRS